MTIETRGTIELKDITAIEFECSKCGSKVVRKLEKLEKPPTDCENCQAQYFVFGSEAHATLHNFLQRLRNYGQNPDANFVLRFEVEGLTQ